MTLYRHRKLLDMVDEPRQTLTDNQLRDHITRMQAQMPAVGETLIVGYMRSNGYYVTRDRVRQSMHATDPINTALRWRGNLSNQRPYSVPGPNSLWHIGENTIVVISVVALVIILTNYISATISCS